MSRHSFFMAVSLASCLFLSAVAFAQRANSIGPLPIDVLYLANQDTRETFTIQTYNVDPGYGNATLAGTLSLGLPSRSFPSIVPSANDHYVYVYYREDPTDTVLQVYATDANGVPQSPPVETVNFQALISQFVIDPNGKWAYGTQPVQNAWGRSTVEISAFEIDSGTGMVTIPPTSGTISRPPLENICSPQNPFGPPGFGLVGFNATGTQLIDGWGCAGEDNSVGYYYTQTVNPETGALGLPVGTVGTSSSEDEYSTVTFTPTAIFSFRGSDYNNGPSGLVVYWPNATLDFSCTDEMLEACGYSGGIATDRTGKFLFFYTNAGGTQVTRVNMENKTIEPVGVPLANVITAFSLDDRLIYGWRSLSWNGEYVIPVYVFDPGTGLVSNNGMEITMRSEYSSLIPAMRY